jgi:hypothetical protein
MIRDTSLRTLFAGAYTYRILLVMASTLVSFLIVDVLLSNLSLVINVASGWGNAVFITIAAIYIAAQYIILGFVKRESKDIRTRSAIFDNLTKTITVFQYLQTGIIISVILQIIITSYYYTIFLTVGAAISYTLACAIITILIVRFLLWYNTNRNFLVLLYAVTSIAIAVRIVTVLFFYISLLLAMPSERDPQSEIILTDIEPDSVVGAFDKAYSIASIVSFLLLWINNALLLHHRYGTLGKTKFLIIIGLIPALTMSDFVFKGIEFDTFNNWIYITIQGATAGILLAVPFWAIAAKSSNKSTTLRDYMTMTGYGLVLFVISGSALIDHAPYPPFGLISIITMQLSSYLIFVGLYSSAVSISADISLRKSIRKNTIDQSKLLDTIGQAELEKELTKRVLSIEKKEINKIAEQTGIQLSITDDDAKEYLKSVLNELGHGDNVNDIDAGSATNEKKNRSE